MGHLNKLSVSFIAGIDSIEPAGHSSTGGPAVVTFRDYACEVTFLATDVERAYAVIQKEKELEKERKG